jgi:Cytosine deaminase and related metal-dependent hydrolases
MHRKISAHYIYPGYGKPLKQSVVVVSDDGTIIDLLDTGGHLEESEKLEFYDGIITPGFVNAHAHLELSHLKGRIPQHTGLPGFLAAIGQLRDNLVSEASIIEADRCMQQQGIVAVGDISNADGSFAVKVSSKIKYHTFVEIFGIQDRIAEMKMNSGKVLYRQLKALNLPASLTPHAPYSMSDALWQLLLDFAIEHNLIWSVHNQECEDENLLFINKSGKMVDFLSFISNEFEAWQAKETTSLEYCRRYYELVPNTLLVHNTFTSKSDLESLLGSGNKITLVLCPNANLYIENKLPDVEMFAGSGFAIALGTDSLASNTRLSVLEEMKTIQHHFQSVELNDLIAWGTLNGARALRMDNALGSIEKGKKPGLNLITDINFREMKLTSQSEVKVLL